MNETMSLPDFLKKIRNGTMFTVHFIKRTNGEERTMNARTGVKKYLSGGELGYDPVEKNLLPVYDLQKEGYRFIPLDAIVWLKYQGKTWYWDSVQKTFVVRPI
jgi:hypothetical protein